MRPKIGFYYINEHFVDAILALEYEFRLRGFDTIISTRQQKPENDRLWIGAWYAHEKILPLHYIAYNLDPLQKKWMPGFKKVFDGAICVWDYMYSNIDILKDNGIKNVKIMPVAFSDYYRLRYSDYSHNNVEQAIDFLFYGGVTQRRKTIIDGLKDKGLSIEWINRSKSRFIHTTERDKYIAMSKIVLSVSHDEPSIMKNIDMERLIYLLANKVFVIAEAQGDHQAETMFSKYVVFCSCDDMYDQCLHYLNNPTERINMATKSYDFVAQSYRLDSFIPFDEVKEMCFDIQR